MKYSTIIGLVLLVVGLILYILQAPDYTAKEFYIAGFLGLGIGLLLGGFMGYAQKKRKKVIEKVVKITPQNGAEPETMPIAEDVNKTEEEYR
ncbi:hypothetical protein [Ornithobacterium rhinotracheale]|uniref:DUF1049 domain-containing protein n=1 Tax=Ornithobacterium rhinotracheale (strain ATCC 51463 / DSM 15997 / CCUG 23171 / CIP 104009 / LMG 9086) TaxID=867902 RepID=I4A120_ORNRL|nr:hypothetical protein [Ornithobacterium rhinotracheale]AFL97654.1 hypothetical protein Ornrh_1481 [Ornithobacterium rhinotracheale DSM 15997]AIP98839.1 hypothetical protein Q785_02520 [Ornithobacterium rhinotracheale ORT-UMN 88]KGB67180.1 hypothetical protein Q787_02370 [Ornithobacterium rhinotracheale H06-030791]MCK0195044.1 hypothetical protein [Ornithobacterium rhinotracheale]MCK0200590.1 hypothetical protein [Ornithobacterium rhinotracheale]